MIRRFRSVAVQVTLLLLLLVPTAAGATVIRYAITGTMTGVSDPVGLYGGVFAVGMPFTGSLAYDTAMVDRSSLSTSGRYDEDPVGEFMELSMSVGGVDITTDPTFSDGTIVILTEVDSFRALMSGVDSTGPPIDLLSLDLFGGDSSVFTSDALPTNLNLADFETPFLRFLSGLSPDVAQAGGWIETLTLLPEPATEALFTAGLVGAALSGRRRRA